MPRRPLPTTLLLLVCATRTMIAQAPVYTLLYTPPSLAVPESNPITILEAAPGLFYIVGARETTNFGYSIFTATSTGAVNLTYSFPPSTDAFMLVQATNGSLYGPGYANQNQDEFYFSIAPSGSGLQQFPVPGGWGSASDMIVVPPAEFYDILAANHSTKRIFALARISEAGKVTIVRQFSGSDGAPASGVNLVYGPDGNFYGVGNQQYGGISPGFIYRITPQGAYSQLLSFPTFPSNGLGTPLIAASDGNLYGIFDVGGTNKTGEIYQATLSGGLQTVASFPAKGMAQPLTLMEAADGNIYGSTNTNSIFRYNLKTHALTDAYQMALNGSQARCACPLIHGMDGKLYGVSSFGGNYPGAGTLFSLDLGLQRPKPAVSALYPSGGPAGSRVLLWGNYLLAAKSVAFNGVPAASFQVTSGQSVWATVPEGATSGPVTIATPNGSFTTSGQFTVQ